ncbi:DUF5819 family protein [Promicromonospora iranensis]|uniref:GyrI-like small molecule binding domain-containing protein n=1 Tax=Promicromonospora iranensis TaxID=1105144 RepID=A0ABU2CTU9_9MICO|nr:DUF5819 family protein [Promicromonospora iranensis]MDR7384760.1 hypothetical protein [Promicromonospora iranensis]
MSVARSGGDEAPAVPARVRCLVVVVWALLLGHFVATFLWAAPGSLTSRPDDKPASSSGTGALSAYMTPVFAQNWSIFAPSPLHVEYALRVRGVYARADGELVPGPWTDTTAVEVRALTGRVLPGATERPARRLASGTRAAYLALPEEARLVVLRSPSEAPALGHALSEPWPALRASLLDAGAAPGVVDDYLARDRALAAYATQVLRADGAAGSPAPAYVQAHVVRHVVTPYGARQRPEPAGFTVGARPPYAVVGQDDAAFRGTWDTLDGSTAAGGGTG